MECHDFFFALEEYPQDDMMSDFLKIFFVQFEISSDVWQIVWIILAHFILIQPIFDYVGKINHLYKDCPIQKNQVLTSISTGACELNIDQCHTDICKVGKYLGENITVCINTVSFNAARLKP